MYQRHFLSSSLSTSLSFRFLTSRYYFSSTTVSSSSSKSKLLSTTSSRIRTGSGGSSSCTIIKVPATKSSLLLLQRPSFVITTTLLVAAATLTSSLVVVRPIQSYTTTNKYRRTYSSSSSTKLSSSSNSYSSFWKSNTMSGKSITTRSADGTITVAPKNETQQSALIVISHGLGDTAEGFVDVAEQLIEHMPYCKFILPTAPTQPVTLNMGMSMPSWYDIKGLDERSNEDCNGIEDSYQRLIDILDTEHTTTQLPYSRMVLAGFSQGAALSLFTGLQLPQSSESTRSLAGIVCLSGYLPALAKFKITGSLHSTPILHCHGIQDMVVQYNMAKKTQSKLQELGCTAYTLKEYTIGHTVSMEELRDVTQFLVSILPDDPSYQITLPDPTTLSVKQLKDAIRKAGLSHKAIGFMEKQEYIQLLQDHRAGK